MARRNKTARTSQELEISRSEKVIAQVWRSIGSMGQDVQTLLVNADKDREHMQRLFASLAEEIQQLRDENKRAGVAFTELAPMLLESVKSATGKGKGFGADALTLTQEIKATVVNMSGVLQNVQTAVEETRAKVGSYDTSLHKLGAAEELTEYCCPDCGRKNVRLQFPVWVDANALDQKESWMMDTEAQPDKHSSTGYCVDCDKKVLVQRRKVR